MKEKKEKEEQSAEEEAERRRKEEAEDAYLKWKEEAKTRPFPLATRFGYPQGSVKGKPVKVTALCPFHKPNLKEHYISV